METTESCAQSAHTQVGKQVRLKGHVHTIRRLGNLAFLILRDSTGLLQCVVDNADLLEQIDSLHPESVVVLEGALVDQPRAVNGAELRLKRLEILSVPDETPPVEMGKEAKIDSLSLASLLDYRPLTLRHPKVRSIFKIEAEICRAFRESLSAEGFTEIHSPKVVATGTEGGAQLFKLDYFGKQAYLAQSPQFYKQIMVGAFERVFEVGSVFRAEDHDTSRHLNEYVSLDYEMGFIQDEQDVMDLEVKLLRSIFDRLKEHCQEELAMYKAKVPEIKTIPQVTLEEAIRILTDNFGWKSKVSSDPEPESGTHDLDPEAERMLCQYFLEKEGSDLVFVTHYPKKSRPFYAMPLDETELTRSFDLLFRGLEITTGGQRIHDYRMLVKVIRERGMDPNHFQEYLQCFKFGMPPHGGLAIGLERLAKQLLGLSNVKEAALFPRDRNRLTP